MLKSMSRAVQSTSSVHNFEIFLVVTVGQIKFVFNILYFYVPRLWIIETYGIIKCRTGARFSSIDFFESFYIYCIPQVVTELIPFFSLTAL